MISSERNLVFLTCATLAISAAAFKPGTSDLPFKEITPHRLLDVEEGTAFRPGYHIIAPTGWMNDPIGIFEYRNVTHVFFQWSPFSVIWASPVWGHAISSDLVHWTYLPAALIPDQPYDEDGVFSGSAAWTAHGTPFVYYTGASRAEELGYNFQQTAVAEPLNLSDPKLVEWHKPLLNPLHMELPANGTHSQFRDPLSPVYRRGRHWTAVGGSVACLGSAILYSSPNLTTWELAGTLANQLTADTSGGYCTPAASRNPDGTRCQQFGKECQAWECPDFFELSDHISVLKYSDQVNDRQPFAADWYMLSDVDLQLSSGNIGSAFKASVKGIPYPPRIIDYGAVYASKSWRASDGRRLWLGWVYETSVGCYQTCAMGSRFVKSMGWQGMLTTIREITYDPDSAGLLFNPIRELDGLRGKTIFSGTENLANHTSSAQAKMVVSSPSLVQSQLKATFRLPENGDSVSSAFVIGTVLRMSNGRSVVISLNGTITGRHIHQASVYVDKSNAGMFTNTTIEGGSVPLPSKGLDGADLALNIFFDHSFLEIFALGGRACVTSRVYAEDISKPDWEIAFFGDTGLHAAASVSASIAEMQNS